MMTLAAKKTILSVRVKIDTFVYCLRFLSKMASISCLSEKWIDKIDKIFDKTTFLPKGIYIAYNKK